MYKQISIHLSVMLFLSVISALIATSLTTSGDGLTYEVGYILGRALPGTLVPLFIASAIAGVYKLTTKHSMPLYFVGLWGLWTLMNVVAVFGPILAS